jgi:FtsP/CotA-like multicopper oxidase with cupredoxin domain
MSGCACGEPRLPQPIVLRSSDGELGARLTGRPGMVKMNAPKLVKTYTFDGVVPGYTWEVRPGDTLKVHLRNRLPKLPPMPMRMDRPHQWTNMNLHIHGLHVSPAGDEDNVFIDIPPGEDHQYEIHVPADHPAGSFWYHPPPARRGHPATAGRDGRAPDRPRRPGRGPRGCACTRARFSAGGC